MTRSAILFKPNVVHVILLNVWEQVFAKFGSVAFAIDGNASSLLPFEEEKANDAAKPKHAPNYQTISLF